MDYTPGTAIRAVAFDANARQLAVDCGKAVKTLEDGLELMGNSRTNWHFVEMSLRQFCIFGHELNRRSGWWTDLQTGLPLKRNVGELLMLITSEISEAQENADGADDHLPEYNGWRVEYADTMIRLADFADGMKLTDQIVEVYGRIMRKTPRLLSEAKHFSYGADIVWQLCRVLEGARKNRQDVMANGIAHAIYGCLLGARYRDMNFNSTDLDARARQNFTLAEPITEKMLYNLDRADHKVANRKLEDGKQF